MKNPTHTEIAFILDRSGSMGSVVEAAISGFNRFLREQQSAPGEARLTLVLFDDQYEVPCLSVPVTEAVELDTATYVPRGSTALLDAVGRTVDELAARISETPKMSRPQQVIVAILTDGHENSSTVFSWKDIASRIAEFRKSGGWEFLFLGADQDAIATASQLNIASSNAAVYFSDASGTGAAQAAMSRKVRSLRAAISSESMTAHESADFFAPLAELTADEDKKHRSQDPGKSGSA